MEPHLTWINECRQAALTDVLRVHEWPWIRQLQAKCETLGKCSVVYFSVV
jgi:hypothetical protein